MKTILVLEDDFSIMKPLAHTLLKNFTLIEATTAEQSLRRFIEHDRKVDLLLADVTLPTSSGIQVALILRSEISDLPVILASGYPASSWSDRDSGDLERLGSHSAVILQKPIPAKLLLNAVYQLIGMPQVEKTRTA